MVYAIVPVKHLATSKSRLAAILTPEERKSLTLAMLKDVINAIKGSMIQETIVVGSDLCVCEVVVNAGATYIEEETKGLNKAVSSSIEWSIKRGAEAVLILPADIPLLSSGDIDKIIELAKDAKSALILSPSRNEGTNALLLKPPNLIPVTYGPESLKKHIEYGRNKDAFVKLQYLSSVAFDIDSQEDLQELSKSSSTTLSAQLSAKVLGTK